METNDSELQSRYWVAKSAITISSNIRASGIVIRLYHESGKMVGGEVAFALSREILELGDQEVSRNLGIPEMVWSHLRIAMERKPDEYLLLNYSIKISSTEKFRELMRINSRKEFKEWLRKNGKKIFNLKHLTWRHAKVESITEVEN